MVIGGVPEKFKELSIESFEESLLEFGCKSDYNKILKAVKGWITAVESGETDMGLFMFGSNGAGKTFLATHIMNSLDKVQSYRTSSIKLQQDFFSNWRVPKEGLFKGLLVIDEFGKEYQTKGEHSESIIEYIIKYRSERKFKTIVISNADIEFIKKRYGETVYSVIRGEYIPLPFPDVDLRQLSGERAVKKFIKNA